ncbi:MAG: hypothetical protein ABJE10_02000 [bacterium]
MTTYTDPVVLFGAAADALNAEDWTAVARLCDPASLAGFRRALLEQFATPAPPFVTSLDEYMRNFPDTPRAVAEHQFEQYQSQMDPVRRMRWELPTADSIAALEALSPEEAFACWLDGKSARRQLERSAAQGPVSPQAAEQCAAENHREFRFSYTAIGVVPDGDRVALIVYRLGFPEHFGAPDQTDPELAKLPPDEAELRRDLQGRGLLQITPCRRQRDGAWLLIAGYDFMFLSNMHASYVREEGDEPPATAVP